MSLISKLGDMAYSTFNRVKQGFRYYLVYNQKERALVDKVEEARQKDLPRFNLIETGSDEYKKR
jgi:hypothetical protein